MNVKLCIEYWLRNIAHTDSDYAIADDSQGEGPYISAWTESLGVQPTMAELQAVEQDAIAWQASKVQSDKPLALKVAENKFLALCDQLTGSTSHAKLGFDQLTTIIMSLPDQSQAMYLSVQLLAIDAECKREGGNMWWNTAEYHNDV